MDGKHKLNSYHRPQYKRMILGYAYETNMSVSQVIVREMEHKFDTMPENDRKKYLESSEKYNSEKYKPSKNKY